MNYLKTLWNAVLNKVKTFFQKKVESPINGAVAEVKDVAETAVAARAPWTAVVFDEVGNVVHKTVQLTEEQLAIINKDLRV